MRMHTMRLELATLQEAWLALYLSYLYASISDGSPALMACQGHLAQICIYHKAVIDTIVSSRHAMRHGVGDRSSKM